MNSLNILLMVVIAAILGLAVLYICKAKKKGVKCIGCPYGQTCQKKRCGGCNQETK